MESSNECMANENECEMNNGKNLDSQGKEIGDTIECDQVIAGKIYHITFTCNKPSDKALSEFANELIEIYNELNPKFTRLGAA